MDNPHNYVKAVKFSVSGNTSSQSVGQSLTMPQAGALTARQQGLLT